MTVIATLKDGRIIAKAPITEVARSSPGLVYTSATLSDLRKVEEILQVNLTSTVQVTPQNPTVISGNVVGLSVYVGASVGSVTGHAIAIGF
jgi:hypothetical protein